MKSKWISVFLTLFMVLSLFAVPLQIWAEGESVEEPGEAAQEENVNSEGGTTGGGAAEGGTTEGDTTGGGEMTPGGPGPPLTTPPPGFCGEPAGAPGGGATGS